MKNKNIALHIEVDIPCKVLYFGTEYMIAEPNTDNVMYLSKGKHRISVLSLENLNLKEEHLLEYSDDSLSDILTICFSKKNEEEIIRLESLRLIPEKEGNLFGYLNIKTNLFEIEPQYEVAGYFHAGLASVRKDNKWGFINKRGDIIIECIYDKVTAFLHGYSIFTDENGYGIISDNGKIIFPSQGKKIIRYDKNAKLIVFETQKSRYGLMDLESNVFDIETENIPYFYEDRAVIKINRLYGHINTKCEITTPCKYEFACNFHNGHAFVGFNEIYDDDDATVVEEEKVGCVDLNGIIIINTEYCKLVEKEVGIIVGKKIVREHTDCRTGELYKDYGYDLINSKGNVVVSSYEDIFVKDGVAEICQGYKKDYMVKYYYMTIDGRYVEYMPIEKLNNGYIIIKKDGKYGMYGENRYIIPCENIKYKCLDDIIVVQNDEYMYGAYKIDGSLILKCEYNFIEEYVPGLLEVKRRPCWLEGYGPYTYGIMKHDGEWLLPFEYAGLIYSEGYYIIRHNRGKEGIVDEQGNIILECIYDEVRPFFESVAFIKYENKWTAIDHKGKTLFALNESDELIHDYEENYCIIKHYGKLQYLNKIGEVLDVNYPILKCEPFFKGFAAVKFENGWNFIDTRGKILCNSYYQEVRNFYEGFAAVKSDKGWNFIDTGGEILCNSYYKDVRRYSDGLAAVMSKTNSKWGYIDTNGEMVIENELTYVTDFDRGYAKVSDEEFFDNSSRSEVYEYYINKRGKYKKYLFYDGLARYEINDRRYTYINKYGICTNEFFSEASDFYNGRAKVKRGGREFYIDVSMNEIE